MLGGRCAAHSNAWWLGGVGGAVNNWPVGQVANVDCAEPIGPQWLGWDMAFRLVAMMVSWQKQWQKWVLGGSGGPRKKRPPMGSSGRPAWWIVLACLGGICWILTLHPNFETEATSARASRALLVNYSLQKHTHEHYNKAFIKEWLSYLKFKNPWFSKLKRFKQTSGLEIEITVNHCARWKWGTTFCVSLLMRCTIFCRHLLMRKTTKWAFQQNWWYSYRDV